MLFLLITVISFGSMFFFVAVVVGNHLCGGDEGFEGVLKKGKEVLLSFYVEAHIRMRVSGDFGTGGHVGGGART